MGNYEDLINRKKPVLHHISMDQKNRAKQFIPFAALKGFEECMKRQELLSEKAEMQKIKCEEILEENLYF